MFVYRVESIEGWVLSKVSIDHIIRVPRISWGLTGRCPRMGPCYMVSGRGSGEMLGSFTEFIHTMSKGWAS